MKIKYIAASGVLIFLLALFAIDSNAMSRRAVRFDDATRQCMKCHNMNAGKHFGPSHTVHIVGIDYVSKARANPSLVPARSLDLRIRLVNDRVSCITCHISYVLETHKLSKDERDSADAENYPFLTVDNRGSGLCLKCHRK